MEDFCYSTDTVSSRALPLSSEDAGLIPNHVLHQPFPTLARRSSYRRFLYEKSCICLLFPYWLPLPFAGSGTVSYQCNQCVIDGAPGFNTKILLCMYYGDFVARHLLHVPTSSQSNGDQDPAKRNWVAPSLPRTVRRLTNHRTLTVRADIQLPKATTVMYYAV